MYFPYGYIIQTRKAENSFLVYGELNKNKNSFISKGFSVAIPNLTHAGNALKNSLFSSLSSYLSRVECDKRIQFKFERDSNYNDMLDTYEADTRKFAKEEPFCKYIREMTVADIRHKMEDSLQRDHLYVYISKPIYEFIPSDFSPDKTDKFEEHVAAYFEIEFIMLKQALGVEIKPMDHIDLYTHFYRSVNKSAIKNGQINYNAKFSEFMQDLYENDYSGLTASLSKKTVCFVGDGYYHNVLTLKDFPAFTLYPFYGNRLLDTNIQNMTVTVNLQSQDIGQVIKKKEKRHHQLSMEAQDSKSAKISISADAQVLEQDIAKMQVGQERPYICEMIIHLWDHDLEQLVKDTTLIRQVANTLHMPFYMHELGAQSLDVFQKTFPGNLYYKKWGDSLETLHSSLAAVIPMSSSFIGAKDFQAIFDGDHNNLVGISPFLGGTPQHAVMFGQSGAGKSVDTLKLLMQSYCFYKKVVIIEEGASYLMFTRIFNGQYIEIDANSGLCLNYFDTCGVPLTPAQQEFVAIFLTAMCGQSNDLDKIQERTAMISTYVMKTYTDAFTVWRQNHRNELFEAAKMAMTIDKILPNQPVNKNTALDAFFDIREALVKKGAERDVMEKQIADFYDHLDRFDVNQYIMENPPMLRNVAYAFMSKEDMPYHSQIVEMIRSTPESYHNREETDRIATLLAQYSIETGQNALFDGYTNIDLSNKLLHFELGKMSGASQNFKAMVGLVISNLVLNLITTMPRAYMKAFIFEEAQRIVATIPSGGDIIKQCYAQLRKYHCWAFTISQEAGQLAESNVGNIIMSQSKQYFFLKNKDKRNLEYFCQYARLPEDTQKQIMEFLSPEAISGRKYSSFAYYVDNGEYPIIGIVRAYASDVEIAVASTSGKTFTERENEIRRLNIEHPDMSFGELLVLYLKRKAVENPAFRSVEQLIGKYPEIAELKHLRENIIQLSLKKQGEI